MYYNLYYIYKNYLDEKIAAFDNFSPHHFP